MTQIKRGHKILIWLRRLLWVANCFALLLVVFVLGKVLQAPKQLDQDAESRVRPAGVGQAVTGSAALVRHELSSGGRWVFGDLQTQISFQTLDAKLIESAVVAAGRRQQQNALKIPLDSNTVVTGEIPELMLFAPQIAGFSGLFDHATGDSEQISEHLLKHNGVWGECEYTVFCRSALSEPLCGVFVWRYADGSGLLLELFPAAPEESAVVSERILATLGEHAAVWMDDEGERQGYLWVLDGFSVSVAALCRGMDAEFRVDQESGGMFTGVFSAAFGEFRHVTCLSDADLANGMLMLTRSPGIPDLPVR